uniref:Putative sodium-dependent multivitamin transporter n=1 Tax=Xenopsylla cheopis TaxID=163159 RepID=A0A6M2DZL7_XENCH
MASFGAWDYAVFILMLLISASIGVYYRFTGGRQRTTQEYLLADRNMGIWPVACSLMASFMSAITLLGVSTENYTFGTLFVIINISYGLATPIAAYLYLPVFFRLQATSAYEYLEKRYGGATRLAASIAYTLQMVLYMGIVLYAPALALEAVTGLSKAGAILTVGLVCTFYSTVGGMKAVLITDVFQSILMFGAIFSVVGVAWSRYGLDGIWQRALDGGRIEFLNFDPDPTTRHTWWSLIIGGGFTYLSLYGVNQTQVQRLLTVKDLKSSQRALWLNWPILSLLSLSTSLSGLAIYASYKDCDPLKEGRISSSDQLMPIFVVDNFSHLPGLSGLFVAGIFSASLSTVSAAVNSLAAVTMEDYVKPLYKLIRKKPFPETRGALHSKLLALFYGMLCVAVAFAAESLGGVLQASLTIFGVVGGPLFGMFTLGMFTTRANQKGVLTGLACGLAFALWIGFGGPKPPPKTLPVSTQGCPYNNGTHTYHHFSSTLKSDNDSDYFYLYRLSYLWYSVLGFLVTFVVGALMSVLYESIRLESRPDYMHLDPNLFSPPFARRVRRKQAAMLTNGSAQLSDIEPVKNSKIIYDTHM